MDGRKVNEYFGMFMAIIGGNFVVRVLELPDAGGGIHYLVAGIILIIIGLLYYAWRGKEDRIPRSLYQATRNMNTKPVEAALSSNDPVVIKNGLEHAKSVLDTLKDLSRGAGD